MMQKELTMVSMVYTKMLQLCKGYPMAEVALLRPEFFGKFLLRAYRLYLWYALHTLSTKDVIGTIPKLTVDENHWLGSGETYNIGSL